MYMHNSVYLILFWEQAVKIVLWMVYVGQEATIRATRQNKQKKQFRLHRKAISLWFQKPKKMWKQNEKRLEKAVI